MELLLNTPIDVYVTGPGSTAPTDLAVFANGNSNTSVSYVRAGTTSQNIWKITFTPTATGNYAVYAFGSVQFQGTCVTRSLYSSLSVLEDTAVGSWQWNKQTGLLTLLRQNGAVLATYNVVDNSTSASREKLS